MQFRQFQVSRADVTVLPAVGASFELVLLMRVALVMRVASSRCRIWPLPLRTSCSHCNLKLTRTVIVSAEGVNLCRFAPRLASHVGWRQGPLHFKKSANFETHPNGRTTANFDPIPIAFAFPGAE